MPATPSYLPPGVVPDGAAITGRMVVYGSFASSGLCKRDMLVADTLGQALVEGLPRLQQGQKLGAIVVAAPAADASHAAAVFRSQGVPVLELGTTLWRGSGNLCSGPPRTRQFG